MQNLKSYRENNPGKGYWDWRNSLPDNLKYTDDEDYTSMKYGYIDPNPDLYYTKEQFTILDKW
ncbi:MAG: hypothetical protein [Bacteriophage sp.]|nr:MAG: hypothetical protein [Bacteriophage sp.]